MLEAKIKERLGQNLMLTDSIEHAFSKTLSDISLAVLDSVVGEVAGIRPIGLRVVRESIKAKSLMTIVAFVDLEGSQVLIPGGTPKAFLEIYRQFIMTAQFLRDNFNDLRFGDRVSRETVAEMLAKISGPTGERLREMESEGGGMSDTAEMKGIAILFNLALQLILGEEIHTRFGNEVNSADSVLKKLRSQFGPATDPGLQSNLRPD